MTPGPEDVGELPDETPVGVVELQEGVASRIQCDDRSIDDELTCMESMLHP